MPFLSPQPLAAAPERIERWHNVGKINTVPQDRRLTAMKSIPRHQCLLYEGPPSRHLATLAEVSRDKLGQNFRCLYLNTEPMVAGMRSYLAAAGVDVEKVLSDGQLIFSSTQDHLIDGAFDADHMLESLADALRQALRDGYDGLWASGDMAWEMGPA